MAVGISTVYNAFVTIIDHQSMCYTRRMRHYQKHRNMSSSEWIAKIDPSGFEYSTATRKSDVQEASSFVADIVHSTLACTFLFLPSGHIMSFTGQDDPFLQAQA